MNRETAERRSRSVGAGSLAIGAGILARPSQIGTAIGVSSRAAKVIATADLAVGAGLLSGRRRPGWMLARALTNLGIVAQLPTRTSGLARGGAVLLGVVTLADLQVARALSAPRDGETAGPSLAGRFSAASSQAMNRRGVYLGKRSTKIHVALYRLSRGRIGGYLPGWPGARIALVDHRGAKSDIRRTSPIMFHADGDSVVIVASTAGQSTHPAWFHNLKAHPETTVQIGGEVRNVHARVATEAERERLWPAFLDFYPGYEFFIENAKPRIIPMVILERRA